MSRYGRRSYNLDHTFGDGGAVQPAALRTSLGPIADVWAEAGYGVPYEFVTVEVS